MGPSDCEESASIAGEEEALPSWATLISDLGGGSPLSLRGVARRVVLSLGGVIARFGDDPFLRCLYGHHVFDDQVDDFRRLMIRLRQIGRFLTSAEVVAIARGDKPLEGRCFHLSFDDGFDNVYRNAVPVLSDLGIPATVFVPTHFVSASDEEVLANWWHRDQVAHPTRPMQWSWLAEMLENAFEIGSHTRSHARLSTISSDPRRLSDEVAGSKQDLEQRLGAPCRYFAWPYGTFSDVDDATLRVVESAGYEGCFSAVRGTVRAGRTHPFSIPRHHFEPEWPWSHVRYFASGGHEAR